ncbi:hypothetical protein WJX73_006037 [Symbiochloris irregularis]|uniref:protein-serine/threonine phosphatase n=1 Tax=Symbiochloris irregularis TaxID=706552 RepID=A0AAW1PBK6_9CHLO
MSFLLQMWGGGNSKGGNEQHQPTSSQTSGNVAGGDHRPDRKVSFGYSLMRGKRASMEDFYKAEFKASPYYPDTVGLFGVFDGHGGPNAADFVRQTLFERFVSNPNFTKDLKTALIEAFVETDSLYLDSEGAGAKDDGCTAITAVLVGQRLVVANVGDSRAVLCRAGKAKPLSEDHKPNRTDERARIEGAGGVVVWAGTWRVGGVLAVSRAFGDRLLKRYVVATPDVVIEDLDADAECVIMATDGLWDVVTNQEACNMVKDTRDAKQAAERLTNEAFSRGSNDNISCVVIRFNFNRDRVQ